MKAKAWAVLGAAVVVAIVAGSTIAQQQTQQRQTGRRTAPNTVKVPEDRRLNELHMQFVREAQKIAVDYERTKQLDKARACYQEILRFVPNYGPAQIALNKIHGTVATAQKEFFDVEANKGWQDTGIDVVEGRPLLFRATGKWHLLMDYPVSPDGVAIPKELRQFNLGSLIGLIVPPGSDPSQASTPAESDKPAEGDKPAGDAASAPAADAQASTGDSSGTASTTSTAEGEDEESKGPRPFFIGKQLDMEAPTSGRLYLRMYDAQPRDNLGKLSVMISGSFGPEGSSSSTSTSNSSRKSQ